MSKLTEQEKTLFAGVPRTGGRLYTSVPAGSSLSGTKDFQLSCQRRPIFMSIRSTSDIREKLSLSLNSPSGVSRRL